MKFIIEGTKTEIMEFIGQTNPWEDRIYKKLCKKIEEKLELNSVQTFPSDEDKKEINVMANDVQLPEGLSEKLSKGATKVKEVPYPKIAPEKPKDIIPQEELTIPAFEYDHSLDRSDGALFFAEMPDGRVALNYFAGRVFTTVQKIQKLPYPTPNGIIDLHLSSNKRTALRLYRKHIAQNPDDLPKNNSVPQPAQALDNNPDRKKHKSNSVRKAPEISFAREDILEDPDWQYKPILKGAFSTRPADADGGKIGAGCGEL